MASPRLQGRLQGAFRDLSSAELVLGVRHALPEQLLTSVEPPVQLFVDKFR